MSDEGVTGAILERGACLLGAGAAMVFGGGLLASAYGQIGSDLWTIVFIAALVYFVIVLAGLVYDYDLYDRIGLAMGGIALVFVLVAIYLGTLIENQISQALPAFIGGIVLNALGGLLLTFAVGKRLSAILANASP